MSEVLYFQLGDKDKISLPDLSKAFRQISGLLADFDAAVSQDRRGTVKWEVTVLQKNSPPLLGVTGTPVKRRKETAAPVDNVRQVNAAVVKSVAMLSHDSLRSATLSDALMQRVRFLAVQAKRIGPIQVYTNEDRAPIDSHTLEIIQNLTGKSHASDGSIIGKLDTIAVHNNDEIRVWDETTKKPVRCKFSRDMEEDIKRLLRKRVLVSGMVSFNPFGQAISVAADSIEESPDDSTLPTIEQMSGLLKGSTNGLSLAEYLERLRNE